MKLYATSLFVAALSATAAMADFTDTPPEYLDLVPITDQVGTGFQTMGVQQTVQMPMIDWSGDFITAWANGGATTDPDSLFALMGVDANLYVENDLVAQLEAYMGGDSPFMRLTQGQAMMVAPITEANDETKMVAVYKHSFSQGDHLIVRDSYNGVEDLCGYNIAIMMYGPHTDFMGRILTDAGCDISAMQNAGQIKWVENLGGEDSPYHAFVADETIDAAFVVTPDLIDILDNNLVPGAKVGVSTQALNRAISDVYVARKDYFLANRDQIAAIVEGLFIAGEEFDGVMVGLAQTMDPENPTMNVDQQNALTQVAQLFPDSTKGGDHIEAGFFYLDADVSGYPGNVQWATETNPRGWLGLNNEVQVSLAALGLSDRVYTISHAAWDYPSLAKELVNTSGVEQPTFNASAVAALVSERQKTGTLDTGELFNFEIFFGPDQNTFPADRYADDFRQLIDFAQAYGGAIITVEGHSDPLGYLQAVDPERFGMNGEPASRIALRRQAQALRNLSATRATAARDSLMEYSSDVLSVSMDPTQFTIVAHGFDEPKTGVCEDLPCAPASEAEWRSNMRVTFRIISVPAEANVFVAAQN